MTRGCGCVNCIVPPHIMLKLLQHKDKNVRQAALNTLLSGARLRTQRSVRPSFLAISAPANGRCTIFDAHGSRSLSDATTVRTQDGPPSADDSVNQAFDGLSATRDFYKDIFDRDSIDNRGMRLDGYVHYDMDYNNAFFDGTEMVFGGGDGQIFGTFTRSVDVIGHELTHGVTQFTTGLKYHNQPGALNESISDVFGSLVKQWVHHQTAEQADWLIGAELFARIASPEMLLNKFSPITGTASPNHVGVANGEKNQHGRAARGGVGGGATLRVGQAGGEGAHTRRAMRDDGVAPQACGARTSATQVRRTGRHARAQAQIRCDEQECLDGIVGGIGSSVRQAAQGYDPYPAART